MNSLFTESYCIRILQQFEFSGLTDEMREVMNRVINQSCAALRAQEAIANRLSSLSIQYTSPLTKLDKKKSNALLSEVNLLTTYSYAANEITYFRTEVSEICD